MELSSSAIRGYGSLGIEPSDYPMMSQLGLLNSAGELESNAGEDKKEAVGIRPDNGRNSTNVTSFAIAR